MYAKTKERLINKNSVILLICYALMSIAPVALPKDANKTCTIPWIRSHGTGNDRDFELRNLLDVPGYTWGDRLRETPLRGADFNAICKHEGHGACRDVWGWSGVQHTCNYVDGHGAVAVCCGPSAPTPRPVVSAPKTKAYKASEAGDLGNHCDRLKGNWDNHAEAWCSDAGGVNWSKSNKSCKQYGTGPNFREAYGRIYCNQ